MGGWLWLVGSVGGRWGGGGGERREAGPGLPFRDKCCRGGVQVKRGPAEEARRGEGAGEQRRRRQQRRRAPPNKAGEAACLPRSAG